jgi:hypothetical protein
VNLCWHTGDPLSILQDLPNLVAVKDADFSKVDAVFCCLPHGTTQVIYFHHAFSEMFMPIAEFVKESSYSLCCPLEDKMLF